MLDPNRRSGIFGQSQSKPAFGMRSRREGDIVAVRGNKRIADNAKDVGIGFLLDELAILNANHGIGDGFSCFVDELSRARCGFVVVTPNWILLFTTFKVGSVTASTLSA